jgi:hypothetical protein
MLSPHITSALAHAHIDDLRRERIERSAPQRRRVRPAGRVRRPRVPIGLRALLTSRA